jgi:hypothetical protein
MEALLVKPTTPFDSPLVHERSGSVRASRTKRRRRDGTKTPGDETGGAGRNKTPGATTRTRDANDRAKRPTT